MTNGTQVVAASTANNTPQQAPTVVMKPGEIQLWRIVNAKVQATLTAAFSGPVKAAASPLPQFRQIAQDGVQFNFFNYDAQSLTSPNPTTKNGTQFTLPAGGRADILVQAPLLPAGTSQASYELAGVCNLIVCGDPVTANFPDSTNYPEFPLFLKDIPPCRHCRTLTFGWEPFRLKNGPAAEGKNFPAGKTFPFDVQVNPDTTITVHANRGPYWTIDDEQFSESKFYQTMILGDSEEWTIQNNTSVPHPFHIHVNPFQVVELSDPNTPANSYNRATNGVWQDNILVPAAKTDANGLVIGPDGKATTPGFVRIRSRFVDFIGSYVLHCHILAHEDRGMMQLVRVIDKATTIKHH
jgi:FtsP/CotA-like multicopper oxidase with cupredoxin domain